MNWFLFDQNNSGGFFITDGLIAHKVFIQAIDEDEARTIAESIGIYFNGVAEGRDCECCGDRWCWPTELEFPLRWSSTETLQNIEEYLNITVKHRYPDDDNVGYTFLASGRVRLSLDDMLNLGNIS